MILSHMHIYTNNFIIKKLLRQQIRLSCLIIYRFRHFKQEHQNKKHKFIINIIQIVIIFLWGYRQHHQMTKYGY
jgi:hypothetical protein